MIEEYIHTPEGQLIAKDPFKQVGARGYFRTQPTYKVVITEESIASSNFDVGSVAVAFSSPPHKGKVITLDKKQNYPQYTRAHFVLVTPESEDWFEVEGY